MRRQETWLELADTLKLDRAPVVACCVYLNMQWSVEKVARELDLSLNFVRRVADASKPLLRQPRAKHECHYCGRATRLTKDHVIPRSRGGTDAEANIVFACRNCNSAKGDRTPEEWLGGNYAGQR